MRQPFGRRMRWITTAVAAMAASVAIFAFYERTRPRLASPGAAMSLAELRALVGSLYPQDYRAALAAVRERSMDHPGERMERLRLRLALLAEGQPDADFRMLPEEVERAAARVLTRLGSRLPTRRDFADAGLNIETWASGRFGRGWPTPFIVTDVDGDGKPDVLFACPGAYSRSVCLLFRQTRQGWRSYRLGVGIPVIGLSTFDITRRGPKAIVLASLPDSEYAPNLFLDVFVWQRGRLSSVLSTRIAYGWQWDHKDLDRDGAQEIRLFAHTSPERIEWRPQIVTTYKWVGGRFVRSGIWQDAPPQTPWEWLDAGRRRFAAGDYRGARSALRRAAHWKPAARARDPSFDDKGGRRQARYFLALCEALLGDRAEAVRAMRQADQRAGEGQPAIPSLARKFLDAGGRQGDLTRALAAVGQVFRALEVSQRASRPEAAPRDFLVAAGVHPDSYQDVDLDGDGRPEALARFGWRGGSAVVAWQGGLPSPRRRMWLLAYGLQDTHATGDLLRAEVLEVEEVFYLPEMPALPLYPIPTNVRVAGVRRGRGGRPSVALTYRQGGRWREGSVFWDGERFTASSPRPVVTESFEAERDRLEALVFERRAYREALQGLRSLARRVRRSSLPVEGKNAILLELYYHQALCHRELGETRQAAVILAALGNGYPTTVWGRLAHRWLSLPR